MVVLEVFPDVAGPDEPPVKPPPPVKEVSEPSISEILLIYKQGRAKPLPQSRLRFC
ncbi:conserved hypothetical protein [Vibrio crassostreae]|uniref:Uncharacterized protein n=1 Tax=Vibrio crassostreae TaxID=246167 RepID=A0A822MLI5_9VIBR|nr:conserved hypothetical protein [Vibrio crassostreae]CAK2241278.1 conserved hypothetical protein [Vibrio crassostreae]CAK2424254.1 conserved hypothetical protein [Vibrio crassostreae]CAK2560924.1 conserved hypothetical protein [Vibrio crassostreae]CAK2566265.1 conserved hypothetical protein [Vibrio crassostreae]